MARDGANGSKEFSGDLTMGSTDCTQSKYLVFVLGVDEYAIPIRRVQEVVGYIPLVPFEKALGIFQGAIAWRGEILPVVDLRITVSQSDARITPQTCIIIVKMDVDGEELVAGFVVDGVCEVLEAPDSAMQIMGEDNGYSTASSVSWGSFSGRSSSVFVTRG